MRVHINNHFKRGLIIILIILIGVLSFLLYTEKNNPRFEEKKISLYSYNNKTNMDYEVFLKPNLLYDKESVGKDNIYITQFVDYIDTSFIYEFDGESIANIQGSYKVIARVEGYTISNETYKVIWNKDFILADENKINSNDTKLHIGENISLDYNQYNDFARQVIQDSKVNSNVRLIVFMNVDVNVDTGKGVIEEDLSPSITIPLNTSYFEVEGKLESKKSGAIEETQKMLLPPDEERVKLYVVTICLLGIILLVVLLLTKGKAVNDPKEKRLNKIFKKYGDRLVALNNEFGNSYLEQNAVESIGDLVKISDEFGRPIMYRYSSNYKKLDRFYVTDDNEIYVYDINKDMDKLTSQAKNIRDDNNGNMAPKSLRERLSKLKLSSSKSKKDKIKKSDIES
ncbi:DUF5305 family protein [Sporosalibacterium faouarense]|uniref:DUF5305 family protein n=1 Tax=Sporosalibacterium faouarense TaxID=516123 RepID=UPI00192AE02F|nr:DUF5305 family protein [Sporosalibacterium faouarense]